MTDELSLNMTRKFKPIHLPVDSLVTGTPKQYRVPIFHDHDNTTTSGGQFVQAICDRDPAGTLVSGKGTFMFNLPNAISGWTRIQKLQMCLYTNQFYTNTGRTLSGEPFRMRYHKRLSTPKYNHPVTGTPVITGYTWAWGSDVVSLSPEGEGIGGFVNTGWHRLSTYNRGVLNSCLSGAVAGKRNISVKMGVPNQAQTHVMWWNVRSMEFKKDRDTGGGKKPHMMAATMDAGWGAYLVLTAVTG
jgi:hypothetical protein